MRQHPAEPIEAKIEVFDWLAEKQDKRLSKNLGGYLAESIRKGYVPPKGFESKMAREKRQADELERKRQAEEAQRRAEAEERPARRRSSSAWMPTSLRSLPRSERLQAAGAREGASFFARQYRRSQGDARSERADLKLIVGVHVSEILADREWPVSSHGAVIHATLRQRMHLRRESARRIRVPPNARAGVCGVPNRATYAEG